MRTCLPATPADFIGRFFCTTCTQGKNRPCNASCASKRHANTCKSLHRTGAFAGHSSVRWEPDLQWLGRREKQASNRVQEENTLFTLLKRGHEIGVWNKFWLRPVQAPYSLPLSFSLPSTLAPARLPHTPIFPPRNPSLTASTGYTGTLVTCPKHILQVNKLQKPSARTSR